MSDDNSGSPANAPANAPAKPPARPPVSAVLIIDAFNKDILL